MHCPRLHCAIINVSDLGGTLYYSSSCLACSLPCVNLDNFLLKMINGSPIITVMKKRSLKTVKWPNRTDCAPRWPASQPAIPTTAKKMPIIDDLTRLGAILVIKARNTGDRQSSPIVLNRYAMTSQCRSDCPVSELCFCKTARIMNKNPIPTMILPTPIL